MPPPATAGRGCAWCASPSTFCRQCRSYSPAGSDLTSRERPAASPRGSHPATSRPWGRQACPAGSAPASALDSMLRCRPRRGRSGACHDGQQQRRRTPYFHMTYLRTTGGHLHRMPPPGHAAGYRQHPETAIPGWPRMEPGTWATAGSPTAQAACGGSAPSGQQTARMAARMPGRRLPVFRERFGPGHGKRHFPAGTAT